ncbi:hypothetical protein ACJMK2_016179 [Sinanodonta woodiana]|uniref:D-isomer specific 2-hydroxyacid dehydrogenase NAD-binding domain-containing protein n=1 Tax=Sinanodonta woodiana TaxID=1069815 RepID=A0ABD3UWG6_SINWO
MAKVYCFTSSYMQFAELLREYLPDVSVVNINPSSTGIVDAEEERDLLENAEVVVGDPRISATYMLRCRKLKWFHSTYAGMKILNNSSYTIEKRKIHINTHTRKSKRPSFVLTRRSTGSKLSAEYVLCYILAIERRLFQLLDYQKNKEWKMWDMSHIRTLDKVTVGLLGVGSIGEEVAKTCKERGMKVIGLVRNIDATKHKSPDVDVYLTYDKLPKLLEESDYICCLLPSTQETRNLLSGDMLAHCYRKRGVLISIGRGDVVDEESIVKAIRNKWIGGAVLDVFTEEPLSAESPLWSLPDVYITPHVSGWSRAPEFKEEIVEEFVSKFRMYQSGKPLPHIIDWEKGY